MSKTAPNSKQQNEIFALLRKCCKSKPGKDGEPDLAVYQEGWSDDRVALTVNQTFPEMPPITSVNVERRRREVYGHLATKSPRSNPRHVILEAKVQELEARIASIEEWAAGFCEYVNDQLLPGIRAKSGTYIAPCGRPRSTPPSN